MQIPEASTPSEADFVIDIVGNVIENAKADVMENVRFFFCKYQDPEIIPFLLKLLPT